MRISILFSLLGTDSFYEYLVKGSVLLQRPELLEMFKTAKESIDKHVKHGDWHYKVNMHTGIQSAPIFESLEAYWPGLLSLIGENDEAKNHVHKYFEVWKQYGFLPDFYNIRHGENDYKYKSLDEFHVLLIDPRGRPTVTSSSDHCFCTCCLSICPHFSKSR